jgi:tetratricopeptide (TPR) repeat protein
LDPNSSDAYASRGFLAVQTGDYSMGFPDIDRAIELSPTNHDAYFKKAHAHIGLNQTSFALDNLDKAIILAPINSDYFYSRGLLRNQLKDYGAAAADFTVSIELNKGYSNVDPRHAKPFVGRGIAYAQHSTGLESEGVWASGPEHALVDAGKALELLEQRFNTPEWDYYESTINLQLSDVHELLGDAYSALDRPEEAQNEYEQSLKYRK